MTTQLVEQLAAAEELLVASDFDGVLAPIVEDPNLASPMAESLLALRTLATVDRTSVAVVSGRDYSMLERLVAPADPFTLVGSHGAEVGAVALQDEEQAMFDKTVAELEALASRYPGLHIEAKTVSVAAHFRRVSDKREAAMAAVEDLASRWPGRVMTGKEVLELSLRHATKGDAVRKLGEQIGATVTLYLGDDVTDEDVFVVLGPQDVGMKVGEGQTAATHRLADPAEVSRFLTALADRRSTPAV